MVNLVSNLSFRANAPQTYTQQQPSQAKRREEKGDRFQSQQRLPKRGFWERNLAAIIGISSIVFVGTAIFNSSQAAKAAKQVAEKAGDALTPKLKPEDVFKNLEGTDIPKLSELSGMQELKKSIQERIIAPITDRIAASTKGEPDISKEWGIRGANGALFYGPPGTGKTLSARALARELNAEIAEISIQTEGSAYINQASKNIGNKFDFILETAEQNPDRHYIIFLDEIDAMAKARGGSGQHESHLEVVNTLLTNFDKAKKHRNVTIIATTNNEHYLDSALRDRMPIRIRVDNPDKEAIEGAITHHLKNSNAARGFDAKSVVDLFEEGKYSNRQLEQIVESALSKGAADQRVDKSKTKLTRELFVRAKADFDLAETKSQEALERAHLEAEIRRNS